MARKGHHSAFAALAKNASIGALNSAKNASSLSRPTSGVPAQEETRGYHYDYFETKPAEVEVKAKESTIEVGIPDVGLDTLDTFFAGLSAPIDAFLATAAKAE